MGAESNDPTGAYTIRTQSTAMPRVGSIVIHIIAVAIRRGMGSRGTESVCTKDDRPQRVAACRQLFSRSWIQMRVSKGLLAIGCALLLLTASDGQVAFSTQADEQYASAVKAYNDGNWPQSAELLRQFINAFPGDYRTLTARFYLGEALLQAGDTQSAATAYEAFIESLRDGEHCKEILARYRIGEIAYLLHNDRRAAFELRSFCDRYPQHAFVYYALPYLAELDCRRGDLAGATRAFQRIATSAAPRDQRCAALYRAAECLEDVGKITAAVDAYRNVLIEFPDQSTAELAARRVVELQSVRIAKSAVPLSKTGIENSL